MAKNNNTTPPQSTHRRTLEDYTPYYKEVDPAQFNKLSVIGNIIGAIPTPATRAAGTVLQLPDLLSDTDELIRNPNLSNAIHLGADIVQPVVRFTTDKYDDIAGAIGMIDDVHTSTKSKKKYIKMPPKLEYLEPIAEQDNTKVNNRIILKK